MAASIARRKRRQLARTVLQFQNELLDHYKLDPNEAIRAAHSWFGRELFSRELQPLLIHNRIRKALVMAVKRCMEVQNAKNVAA